MRKLLFSFLILLSISGVSVYAQRNYRIQDSANQLQRSANDLADRTYGDFSRRSNNTRTDVDALMLTQQMSASANLLSRMITDNRRNSELRDAVNALSEMARRASSNSTNSYQWRDIQQAVDNLSREIGGSGNYNDENNGNNSTDNRPIIGNLNWRGTVDDTVQLVIRGDSVEVKTLSGRAYENYSSSFTSPLPNRRVDVEVNKKKGRGSVRVMQQPRRENNFTTVIELRDKDGGAKDYELEVYWR